MTVRAKLQLAAITDRGPSASKELLFQTVYDPTIPEDLRFQRATPYGEFKMNVDNPNALEQFSIGCKYYVDFNLID